MSGTALLEALARQGRPLPVEIVRPKRDWVMIVEYIIATAVSAVGRGFVVMLIAGHFGFTQIGYWDAVLIWIAVNTLWGSPDSVTHWTRSPRRGQ